MGKNQSMNHVGSWSSPAGQSGSLTTLSAATKPKRVRLTDSSLNSYGTRILTEGVDTSQYERNPVLLFMHFRGEVIGYMKDIRKEDDAITAEPVFDEASELSRRCKLQMDFGSLRMVSVGIDIVETTNDPKTLVQGQTRETISKSKLVEVSVVDIGANDNAIVLYNQGKQLTLSTGEDAAALPPMLNQYNLNDDQMNLKKIAVALALAETATEEEVLAKISELSKAKQDAEAELERLRKENKSQNDSMIETMVDGAIAAKKINTAKRQEFIELGKNVGRDNLSKVFAEMQPQVKIADLLASNSGQGKKTYAKLSEVPEQERIEMRENNRDEYVRLYKAEYGIAPSMD